MSWFNKKFVMRVDPDGRYAEDRKVQPVKTYKLTPEELARYQNIGTKKEKAPAFIGLEYQTRREKKEMDKKSMRLSREIIVKEFQSGKTPAQISEEYGKAEFWIRGQLTKSGLLEPVAKESKPVEISVSTAKKIYPKKFYISSERDNIENVKRLASLLKTIGWEQTYDWTTHIDAKDLNAEEFAKIAEAEMQGIRDADVVIVLLLGGYGTHAELGAANILGKEVYIWTQKNRLYVFDYTYEGSCIFYFNKNVERVIGQDMLELVNILLEKECHNESAG